MRKFLAAILLFVAVWGSFPRCALGSAWEGYMDGLEAEGLTDAMDRAFRDAKDAGAGGWRQIVRDVMTGKGLDLGGIGASLGRTAFSQILASSQILGKIMLLGVAMACLEALAKTVAPGGSSTIASWASHLALIALGILSFREVLLVARGAMENLRAAFFAFVPALLGLTAASGMPVTAGVLHPLVFGMGGLVAVFILDVAFPLVQTSVAMDMAGNLGGGERAAGVAVMLRQAASLGMGVFLACFVGIVAGQRAAAGVADGMAYRTAKYMSSTFIPVAGKMVSDSMEMFFWSAHGLKSAVGLAGVVALLGCVFAPLVRILLCAITWRVALAVLGPLCGVHIQRSMKSIADGVVLLAVSVFVTSFVFVICLSLVSRAANPF